MNEVQGFASVSLRYQSGRTTTTCHGAREIGGGIAADSGTRFNCGSVGKLVVGSLCEMVWPDASERAETTVAQFLPGIPTLHGSMTLEACLTHRTGLWDFRSLLPLYRHRNTDVLALSDVLSVAFRQASTDERYLEQYSSTNYVLLGLCLESSQKLPLRAIVERYFGLTVGNFVSTPRHVIDRRVRGYEFSGEELFEVTSFVDCRGASNFWASADELVELARAVSGNLNRMPTYGGFPRSPGVFVASGTDGGCRSVLSIDTNLAEVAIELTNDPDGVPVSKVTGRSEGVKGANNSLPGPGRAPSGLFDCGGLGVDVNLAPQRDGAALLVEVGGERLGALDRRSTDSFADEHIQVEFDAEGGLWFSINHARGLPLVRKLA